MDCGITSGPEILTPAVLNFMCGKIQDSRYGFGPAATPLASLPELSNLVKSSWNGCPVAARNTSYSSARE